MSAAKVQEIAAGRVCPSCRDGATSPVRTAMARVYQYALAYLCAECREWWMAADDAAHAKGNGRCPHHPRPCATGREECTGEWDMRMVRLGGSRS